MVKNAVCTEKSHPSDAASAFRVSIVDALYRLYISYQQRYNMILPGGQYFTPRGKNGPTRLTRRVVYKHVCQSAAISIYAGSLTSKFICLDIDDGSKNTVKTAMARMEVFGIPLDMIHVSTSGGKGFHVEVFFDALVSTATLRRFYDWIVETGSLHPEKVEFRPTHKQSIKLPLSVHGKTGRICWYFDRDTLEPVEDMAYILGIKQFSAKCFLA